jgi:hypothetical protein
VRGVRYISPAKGKILDTEDTDGAEKQGRDNLSSFSLRFRS